VNLEFFRGKIVPILKGIVVCAEYEAILTEVLNFISYFFPSFKLIFFFFVMIIGKFGK